MGESRCSVKSQHAFEVFNVSTRFLNKVSGEAGGTSSVSLSESDVRGMLVISGSVGAQFLKEGLLGCRRPGTRVCLNQGNMLSVRAAHE